MSDHPIKTLLMIVVVLVATAGVVVLLADVVEIDRGRLESRHHEFRQVCAQAGGKAVHNGKHLECIK